LVSLKTVAGKLSLCKSVAPLGVAAAAVLLPPTFEDEATASDSEPAGARREGRLLRFTGGGAGRELDDDTTADVEVGSGCGEDVIRTNSVSDDIIAVESGKEGLATASPLEALADVPFADAEEGAMR